MEILRIRRQRLLEEGHGPVELARLLRLIGKGCGTGRSALCGWLNRGWLGPRARPTASNKIRQRPMRMAIC